MNKSKFSQNLIEKTIKVFKQEDGLDLTPEVANEYLQRFAGLYLAFARKGVSGVGDRAPEGAGAPPLT